MNKLSDTRNQLEMMPLSERAAAVLARLRWVLLVAGVLLAALSWSPARRIQFDHSIENMFAPNDPLLPPYQRLRDRFGGNEIVLVVYQDEQLLAPQESGLRRLTTITERLRGIEGVRGVLSLAELDAAVRTISFASLVAPGNPTGKRFLDLLEGYTHGDDGKTACVTCMLDPTQSRRRTIALIREAVEQLPDGLGTAMIAGEPVMVVDGFQFVERDGARLGWVSTVLLGLVLIVCFRRVRWMILPIAIVQTTLWLTKATVVWSGMRMSMVSSMLSAVITVVGVGTIVHVIVQFREARRRGLAATAAFTTTASLLAAPIFWSCATDAVGFASLRMSHVGPVRDFGTMMAIGSAIVILMVLLLTPGIVLWGAAPGGDPGARGEGRMGRELGRWLGWAQRRPWFVGIVVFALLGLAVVGNRRLEVETDFTRNFRSGSRLVESYAFIETHLGGAGAWDIVLPAPRTLDAEYLASVMKLEESLRAIPSRSREGEPALTKVISLADVLDASGKSILPTELRVAGMATVMPAFVGALRSQGTLRSQGSEGGVEAERGYFRIMLRAHERQPAADKLALIELVRRQADEFAVEHGGEADVTGFYVLLTHLIRSIVKDQWVCFAVATGGIGLMGLVAFRSVRLALIALVPNALPIYLVLGMMGWLQLKINMGAAMIAAVSMGLSIDSSIHYILSFLRARAAGHGVDAALVEVQDSVGRALVFSTLALMVGFTVLCASEFVPTVYFGALVSLSMLGGMFGNLLVLPWLLRLTTRE